MAHPRWVGLQRLAAPMLHGLAPGPRLLRKSLGGRCLRATCRTTQLCVLWRYFEWSRRLNWSHVCVGDELLHLFLAFFLDRGCCRWISQLRWHCHHHVFGTCDDVLVLSPLPGPHLLFRGRARYEHLGGLVAVGRHHCAPRSVRPGAPRNAPYGLGDARHAGRRIFACHFVLQRRPHWHLMAALPADNVHLVLPRAPMASANSAAVPGALGIARPRAQRATWSKLHRGA
mmetsp:Transcript_53111/g.147811  ORF Transcript_53111/g.147811 Transcript_53111/m.147811 type:complete len:229 (+) Transcript_53111:1648-2334(+)